MLAAMAALLLWQGDARATHAMGGDLTYECLGNGQYKVILNLFRDCNGVAAPTNCYNGRAFRVSSASCGAQFYSCFSLESVEVITPICVGAPDRCNTPSGVYGVERYKFSTVIDLGAWSGCGADWLIDWQLCCRNNAITSLNNPGSRDLYLYATLDNTLGACNSSPRFLNDPVPFGCVGQPMVYNHGLSDLAGDSLTFELAPARGTNGGLIPYNAGYTYLQPVVTAGGANAVQIDPQTGTITFVPSIQQFAVVTVLVKEFRNGVQIGSLIRDVQFAIIACSNNNPTASGIDGSNSFIYDVCAGESFCFDVISGDPDAGQVVTMTWNNAIPGASFNTSGGAHPVGTFCWTPPLGTIGQQHFTVTVEDDACLLNGFATQGYVINITPPFVPANAGSDQQICGTAATLAATAVHPQVQGTWSILSGTGTFAQPNSPTTTVTNVGQGVNVYRWSVDYGTCGVTTDEVVVTSFNPAQASADAGPNQQLCTPNDEATLAANAAVAPAIGTWTVMSGTGTFADPNSPNTLVSGLSIGQNVLRWTINNGPCGTPTSDNVTIQVYDYALPAANAGPDQYFCAPPASVQMDASPNNGTWTVVSGSGVFANPNSRNTTVTGVATGVNIFQWTINNGPCDPPTTNDQVSVFVFDPGAAAADAGPDQSVCATTTDLAGNSPVIPAQGTWMLISGGGTITSPNDPNSTVTGLGLGNNVFQWTVNNGPCGSTSDQVTITRFDPSTPAANAGADQQVCSGGSGMGSTTLSANSVVSPAVGTWSVVNGTAVFANANSATTNVTGLSIGTNTLRWTVGNGPCAPPTTFDDVVITVFDQSASPANAGPDQQHCSPVASIDLAAIAPASPATGSWSVVSGSGVFADANDPATTVTGMAIGNNVYRWTTNNGPCPGSITADDVTISIYDQAAPAADAGPDQFLCVSGSTALAANAAVAPAIGTWSVISGTAIIADPNSPTTGISAVPVGITILRWTIDNGPCGTSFDEVTITRNSSANPIANAGPDQSICVPVAPNTVTLAGSNVIAPATGTWTQISGAATIVDPNDPNTAINDLTVGVHEFQWTVDNGACASGVTTDVVRINVHDVSLAAADAGPDQSLCASVGSTTMAAAATTVPATGEWTLISGTASIEDPFDPNSNITGLAVGQNIFQWTVDNGPCGITIDQMSIFIYDPDNAVADAGDDQGICTDSGNSVFMQGSLVTFPATGTWTVSGGPATIVDPNDPYTTVTDLVNGTYQLTWTVNNGVCADPISSSTMEIVVASGEAPPAAAGPDQSICDPSTEVTLAANMPLAPGVGTWSVIDGSAVFADPSSPTTTVTGLSVGMNVLEWEIDNLECGVTTDLVMIFVFDPAQPVADAGPDQQLCSPVTSTNFAGSPLIGPAMGQWTLISGSGTIANPASPTSTVSGLSPGENIFQWQVNNGVCPGAITTDQVSIFVYSSNAPDADAGADQEICTPQDEVTMTANSPVAAAIGTWTLVNGGGTIVSPNDPNTTISDLPVGLNVFEWTIDNGSCGSSSDLVSILVFDGTNADADAGPDQELCTPTISATLAGNAPIFPATGEWTLISGAGTITDPSDPASAVTGLSIGENIFAWTVDNGVCANGITSDQVSIFLFNDADAQADAGADQEFCSPVNSTTLTGSPFTSPAIANWELVTGTGTITDPSAQTTTVTGLSIGVNTFSYTLDNGACGDPITMDEISILIYDEDQPAADAGADQELCAPDEDAVLAGNSAIAPAIGTWTLVSGTGSITDPNDPNTTVSGLSIGENIFRWTIDNGPCEGAISFDEVSIFVFDPANPEADAGSDQELCTPITIVTLAGSNVIFPASGEWTLISGIGLITDPTSPTTTVTNLGLGENIFEWTVSNGPCASGITSDQVTITLFDANNPVPDAGADQSLCTPITATSLQGSAVAYPATGMWELISGSGTITDPADPNTTVTGLAVGENVFSWTVANGACETGAGVDVVSIFVYDDQMPAADAGPDQQLCTSNIISTTLAGSAITFPATGIWTLVSGTGTIGDPGNPTSAVVDLAIGENVFEWTVDNGPCGGITTDQVTVFVYDEGVPEANAGPDQALCTPIGAIQLQGSAVNAPAVGVWTMISGTGTITDLGDPATTITGATPGVITMEWAVSNGACPNSATADTVVITLYDGNTPEADAGPDQQVCASDGDVQLQGSAIIFPAVGTWQVVTGPGVISDVNDPAATVSGLSIGENIFMWTVINGPCEDLTTDMVSIFVYDPNVPLADAGPDQQVCTPLTNAFMAGSAINGPAVGTWSLVSGQGTIVDVNDPSTNITGLGIGTNIFEWTVDNGACPNGITFDQVSIVLFDANAPPADAGPDQQFCAPDDEATMAANVPVGSAIGTWDVVQGTGNFSDANDPGTLVTGISIGENIFTWTLESGDCATTIDSVSVFIFDPNNPIANAGLDQQLCVPQDSVFMAGSLLIAPATGTWHLVSGSGIPVDANDPGTLITQLAVGENIFEWEVSNGPCANGLTSDQVSITIYSDSTAAANAGPDLQTCLPLTSIQLDAEMPPAPAEGTWSVIAGTGSFADANDPLTMVSGLSQGVNTFVWTLDWDPCPNNGTLTDTVNVLVYDPTAPIADAGADQQICGPGVQATMQANTPMVPGVGTWSVLQGTATVASINDPNSVVDDLDVGEHVLLWTIYNGMCGFGPPSTDTVRIAVFDGLADPAFTGADISICTPTVSTVLQGSDPIFPGTGLWELLIGAGDIVDDGDPLTAVNNLGMGQNDFRWTIDNGPCGSTSAMMSVFVFDGSLEEADAGPDQTLCTPESTTNLDATPVTAPVIGTWTLISGTGTIDDPSLYNTAVSGLSIGANVFQWTVGNGPCGESFDQVTITVFDQDQPAADAGADQQLCTPATSATMQGSPVAFPATGTWQVVSGNASITDPTSPNTTITGLGVGTVVLEWTVDNGPCANGITSDQVAITIFDGSQQAAAAGPDQAYCTPIDGAITMFANTPEAPSTAAWSVISGNATVVDESDPFTEVIGAGPGTHTFLWTVDNGVCGTTSDEITIAIFDHTAPAAEAGESLDLCENETSAQLSAVAATSTATGWWSLMEGGGTIAQPADPNSMVNDLPTGYNWFTWTIDNGPCGSTSDTLLIKLRDCLTLRIPNAFSPNGDGVNEVFYIENIGSYPQNALQIFNRWGNKVYEQSPYNNEWDGTSQFGAMFGEKLPESTYYYVLDLGDDKESHTGYIFLRR